MKRMVEITADGSPTIAIPEMQVTYHSRHGAVQESMHVFIEAGLRYMLPSSTTPLRIFEMGFGTGLNAWLSWQEAMRNNTALYYYAVEKFPLQADEYALLEYGNAAALQQLHKSAWNTDVMMDTTFTLHKKHAALTDIALSPIFDVIYYDAFAPNAQPELWTTAVFEQLFSFLQPGGILVTYCSKGDVRRAMIAAGFMVEKIPGPPGKREMLRAKKAA